MKKSLLFFLACLTFISQNIICCATVAGGKRKLKFNEFKATSEFAKLRVEIAQNDEGRKLSFTSLKEHVKTIAESIAVIHQKIELKKYFFDDFANLIVAVETQNAAAKHLKQSNEHLQKICFDLLASFEKTIAEQQAIIEKNKDLNEIRASFILQGLLIYSYDQLLALARKISEQSLKEHDEFLVMHMADYPQRFLVIMIDNLDKLSIKSIENFACNLSRVTQYYQINSLLKNLNAKRYEEIIKELHQSYTRFADLYGKKHLDHIEKNQAIISKKTRFYNKENKKLFSLSVNQFFNINNIIKFFIQNTFENNNLIKPLQTLFEYCSFKEKELREKLRTF